jgi:hypothetical protein
MRVVEKLRGHGTVTGRGSVVLEHVPYRLTVWNEQPHEGDTGGAGGRRHIDGRIGIGLPDAYRLMEFDEPLRLTLEDGRTLNFVLTNSHGRIARTDGGTL